MATFIHLDKPDPVKRETISNPNIRPDWTQKSGSCTPLLRMTSPLCNKWISLSCHQRWSESLFLTPAPVPKKVTPAPALELIRNLHFDSCLHSEIMKAECILPHEVK